MSNAAQPHHISPRTYLSLALIIFLWASAYVGIRIGLTAYSPGPLALLRYLVASICMLFIYRHQLKHFRRMSFKDFWQVVVAGIFGFSIYNIALNYSEQTVTAGTASFILCQIPVIITLLTIIFRDEKFTQVGWLGTIISFFGILLISLASKGGIHFNAGVGYCLVATAAGSIFSFWQKSLLQKTHPIEFTAISIWAGTAALMIYAPTLWHEIPAASYVATFSAIYNGIFPAALAYLLWSYVVAQMPMAKAASFLYLIPVATVFLGWLLLREIPLPLAIVGGMFALLGAFLVRRGVIHRA
jgi:drug/metabolite transporter (DMT)-like permease